MNVNYYYDLEFSTEKTTRVVFYGCGPRVLVRWGNREGVMYLPHTLCGWTRGSHVEVAADAIGLDVFSGENASQWLQQFVTRVEAERILSDTQSFAGGIYLKQHWFIKRDVAKALREHGLHCCAVCDCRSNKYAEWHRVQPPYEVVSSSLVRTPKVRLATPSVRPIEVRYTCPNTKREIRISTGTRDPEQAEQRRRAVELELLAGIRQPSSSSPWRLVESDISPFVCSSDCDKEYERWIQFQFKVAMHQLWRLNRELRQVRKAAETLRQLRQMLKQLPESSHSLERECQPATNSPA